MGNMKFNIAVTTLSLGFTSSFIPPLARKHVTFQSASVDETDILEGTTLGKPGTAKMDVPWEELGFEFRQTKNHLRLTYRNGSWGEPELVEVILCNAHSS